MCGSAAPFALERDGHLLPGSRDAVAAMTTALAHRGPDADGFSADGRAALGHRRLAIIDRAGGHQPMANEDDSCWIVFNGEVYNHRQLRPVLETRGHRFRTPCDTESILRAYEEFGPACVEKLEPSPRTLRRETPAGQEAVLLHGGTRTISLRQRATGAPRIPDWQGEADLTTLEGYLSLGYFLVSATPYRDVLKLLPGHWLRVTSAGVETRRYWDVDTFDVDDRPPDQLIDEIDQTLRKRAGAARKRSSPRRVPQRWHRFGPGRVLHGRAAR